MVLETIQMKLFGSHTPKKVVETELVRKRMGISGNGGGDKKR